MSNLSQWNQPKAPDRNFKADTTAEVVGISNISQPDTAVIPPGATSINLPIDITCEAFCPGNLGIMLTQEAISLGVRIVEVRDPDENLNLATRYPDNSAQVTDFGGEENGTVRLELTLSLPDTLKANGALQLAYAGVVAADGKWLKQTVLSARVG